MIKKKMIIIMIILFWKRVRCNGFVDDIGDIDDLEKDDEKDDEKEDDDEDDIIIRKMREKRNDKNNMQKKNIYIKMNILKLE